jgi:hypothetical protein
VEILPVLQPSACSLQLLLGSTFAHRWHSHCLALCGYALVAVAFAWPLPLQLTTHLTGNPAGDTGVYVWNQWVFRHELVDQHRLPYLTDALFGPDNVENLSLHNYTAFQNLIAVPLIGVVGVVGAFNLVYLLMSVMTAYATFLLARRITGLGIESWLAGLLFAWSPVLVARGTAHFSLVAAAPLPLFLLFLMRAECGLRLRDAVGLGATLAMAAITDVYYAVYCLVAGGLYALGRRFAIEPRLHSRWPAPIRLALDVLVVGLAGLVSAIVITGGWDFTFFSHRITIHSVYTPILVLTVLGLARLSGACGVKVLPAAVGWWRPMIRFGLIAALVASLILSPVLYAAGERLLAGDFDTPQIFWRSSPSGIDVLSMFLPNPNHPLAPRSVVDWVSARSDGFAEAVASLPWVALFVVAGALHVGWRVPRPWLVLLVGAGLLALGPFVHVAGVNTYVPGPWALLRYVPLLGLARTPARFSVLLTLAVAIIFAVALVWLRRRTGGRTLLPAIAALLVFELWPSPRPLYSAEIPALYRHVAAAPAGTSILEIPFGVRDGTLSVGNFTARTLYFQTAHGRTLTGGYVSRLAQRRVSEVRGNPVLNALATLSENLPLSADAEEALIEGAPAFLGRNRVRFVIIDRRRASAELQALATRAFDLELVETNAELTLYRPRLRERQPAGDGEAAGVLQEHPEFEPVVLQHRRPRYGK